MSLGTPRLGRGLTVLAAAAVTAACATHGPDARTIVLEAERGFVPSELTVQAGDDVVFDNRTTRLRAVSGHVAGSSTDLGTQRLLAYESWTVQLDEPGTYLFAVSGDPLFSAVVEVTP